MTIQERNIGIKMNVSAMKCTFEYPNRNKRHPTHKTKCFSGPQGHDLVESQSAITVNTEPYLNFVCGAAARCWVNGGGRERGAELSLPFLHSLRKNRQLPLQQQLLQSALLLHVQNGLRLVLQQLVALTLNLRDIRTVPSDARQAAIKGKM